MKKKFLLLFFDLTLNSNKYEINDSKLKNDLNMLKNKSTHNYYI